MGKLIVTKFVSLDGVMEAPGGEPGFKHTAWTTLFPEVDEFGELRILNLVDTKVFPNGVTVQTLRPAPWERPAGEAQSETPGKPGGVEPCLSSYQRR